MVRGCITTLVALNTAALGAQHRGALTGYVMSQPDRTAVAGAEIVLPDLNRGTVTDTNGVFLIASIPKGEHRVTVRRLGFAATSTTLRFSDADTVRQLFVLTAAQTLDSVVVTAKSSNIPGFEERRAKHIGSFITRDELERQKDKRMSDILVRVPGLSVEETATASQAYIRSKRGTITMKGANPACYAHIYVDGAAVYNTVRGDAPYRALEKLGLFDVNSVSPNDIEAIEWYSGGASQPAEYRRTGSGCGVLVIWTRRFVKAPK